jgi:hypothetical protein
MTSQHMLKASLVLVGSLLLFVGDPSPVRADATGPSAYNYREEPGIPVQVSGSIKQIKEVAVHDTGLRKTGIENTVVLVQPDEEQNGIKNGQATGVLWISAQTRSSAM